MKNEFVKGDKVICVGTTPLNLHGFVVGKEYIVNDGEVFLLCGERYVSVTNPFNGIEGIGKVERFIKKGERNMFRVEDLKNGDVVVNRLGEPAIYIEQFKQFVFIDRICSVNSYKTNLLYNCEYESLRCSDIMKVYRPEANYQCSFTRYQHGELVFDRKDNFNYDEFVNGKLVVNCKTENDANIFLAYLYGKGLTWANGDSLLKRNYYHEYEGKICYARVHLEGVAYCGVNSDTALSLKIIEFDKENFCE